MSPPPAAQVSPEGAAGTGLDAALLARLDDDLAATDALLAGRYSGRVRPGGLPVAQPVPQPVHTVYVPADAAEVTTPAAWGAAARALLDEHASTPGALAAATGLDRSDVEAAWPRLLHLLATRPIADLRIDLEDGYGAHPDAVEDADAVRAGATLAAFAVAAGDGESPASAGVRVRSMEVGSRRRSLATLDLVLGAFAAGLPRGLLRDACDDGGRLVVTLAKVAAPAQVGALVDVLDALESAHGLPAGLVAVEVQVEVPALIVAADGRAAVAACLDAARGRCTGLHYGTYDFSAACGVPPAHQSLEHPLADHAKAVLQLATAGTGVFVSDGSTNVVPSGGTAQVRAAWGLHARLVRRALERGLAQGWDLHPGHLVTRHLANLVFYAAAAPEAIRRLGEWAGARGERDPGGEPPGGSSVMDEPATAQAMAALLTRGAAAGAFDLDEAAARAGFPVAQLLALAARRVA